jgi:hypothetical protein
MRLTTVILVTTLFLIFSGCGGLKPEVQIYSSEYVSRINVDQVMWTFEGYDIVQIKLDFNFRDELTAGLDKGSEDFEKELYSILVKGAHFYIDSQEADLIQGYWPVKSGSTFANELTLFYLVPEDHPSEGLRFVYDGTVLGEGGTGLDVILDLE